ncbi:MAG: sugar phosphate isomerase/epimerase family protein [Paenibacillus macerans]|uniref:sugar phosphate isomerase/epimerase family protein n=1 Tax=Paenibacillus TaxID=44249 RepID=UPI000F572A82|nr:sugar phosphate isomerase/epimerase family protein [Paenibacillus macerans]MBS5914831.1 sugar phosphate isomerase/epimerase [Paenibacillus macerans]MCY7558809.1 sugar phosphate isomerase/epimerase [Paenibacillus macerans]MDU7476133.1 sugar phosphate isomerase/epimerase family protein [Paenibacillus macerans]MEC0139602.1 sugar phosphate isomerase/epimerase [Paenibacillus macerans]MEC0149758.1 sugar phosphate isomerase/epimerase [Paenibacillus macerans]
MKRGWNKLCEARKPHEDHQRYLVDAPPDTLGASDTQDAVCVPDTQDARCEPNGRDAACVPDTQSAPCAQNTLDTACAPNTQDTPDVPITLDMLDVPLPQISLEPGGSNMKFSLCSTGLKSLTLEEVLAACEQLGLQGAELWIGHLEDFAHRGGTSADLRRLLARHRLAVPAISDYTYFSRSDSESERDVTRISQAAEWAAAIGCPRIRTFAGHLASREASGEQWSRAFIGLDKALNACREQGVKLAVEIHNGTFADTADSLAALLGQVGQPRQIRHPRPPNQPNQPWPPGELELIYDGFNLFVDRLDPLPVLKRFYGSITHVHFKDYRWNRDNWALSKPVPVLQGDADHRSILKELRAQGYGGFISFEYFGEDVLELTRQSYAEVRDYLSRTTA